MTEIKRELFTVKLDEKKVFLKQSAVMRGDHVTITETLEENITVYRCCTHRAADTQSCRHTEAAAPKHEAFK